MASSVTTLGNAGISFKSIDLEADSLVLVLYSSGASPAGWEDLADVTHEVGRAAVTVLGWDDDAGAGAIILSADPIVFVGLTGAQPVGAVLAKDTGTAGTSTIVSKHGFSGSVPTPNGNDYTVTPHASGVFRRALFLDAFTRADSTTTLGPDYDLVRGTWGISSNRAYLQATAGDTLNHALWDAGSGDFVCEATWETFAAYGGLVARAASNSGYLIFNYQPTELIVYAYDQFDGSPFDILLNTPMFPASGARMRVAAVGSKIRCYLNGSLVGSEITSSYLATASLHGLRSDNSSPRFDDLRVEGAFTAFDFTAEGDSDATAALVASFPAAGAEGAEWEGYATADFEAVDPGNPIKEQPDGISGEIFGALPSVSVTALGGGILRARIGFPYRAGVEHVITWTVTTEDDEETILTQAFTARRARPGTLALADYSVVSPARTLAIAERVTLRPATTPVASNVSVLPAGVLAGTVNLAEFNTLPKAGGPLAYHPHLVEYLVTYFVRQNGICVGLVVGEPHFERGIEIGLAVEGTSRQMLALAARIAGTLIENGVPIGVAIGRAAREAGICVGLRIGEPHDELGVQIGLGITGRDAGRQAIVRRHVISRVMQDAQGDD